MANKLQVYWYNKRINFGDTLNEYLVKELSQQEPELVPADSPNPYYMCIGSILQFATKNSIVWGSGLISKEKKMLPKESPQEIHAVRGPLTKLYLEKAGISCPDTFGDPALLLPRLYQPVSVKKKYRLGIIPHFINKEHPWVTKAKENPDIKIIDIQNPDLFQVIDQIASCENIASSSLHGLIVADAYGIPNVWIEFPEGIFMRSKVIGGGFKFQDYFQSVYREVEKPFKVKKNSPVEQLYGLLATYSSIKFNTEKLLTSCPFLARP